jgi:hypothetical protein
MPQARFWKEFHALKVETIFVQKLLLDAERKERLAKMATAITSSASIGAWAVWKDWALLWGAIIAGSQVFSVIHPLLPYKDRLKMYSSVLRDLEKLFIDAEHKWQAVADGSMSVSQINKERATLQKKSGEIVNKYVPNGVFPPSAKITELAEKEASEYFLRYYPQGGDAELQRKLLGESNADE